MYTLKQSIKSHLARGVKLGAALFVAVATLTQVVNVRPAFADTGGYPWSDATTLSASTYDWGYSSCPTSDSTCKNYPSFIYTLNGTQYGEADPWIFYLRNCTSYMAWKISQVFGVSVQGWGNAKDWDTSASSAHYTVYTGSLHTPQVGEIAQWEGTTSNPQGHVAYVYDVINGVASLSEYNVPGGSGSYGSGRTTASNSAGTPDHYIHIGDVSGGGTTAHPPADWDNDSKTNQTVFRPSSGTWYWRDVGDGAVSQQYGLSGDIPAPGYYSGGAKPDYAVYRPSNQTWYVRTQAGSYWSQPYGVSGDIPVPGDYNGDGKTDYAIFRPSDDTWHYYDNGTDVTRQFGSPGDIPVPAYWDGGSKTEPGVFRPSTGTWYYLAPTGTVSQQFGLSGDIPMPGYYSGATKPDFVVYRPSNETWYVRTQAGGVSTQPYGASGDVPVTGDYNGDGKTDFAIYRPSDSTWHYYNSGVDVTQAFGLSGDIPAVSTLPLPLLQQYGLM